VLFFLGRHDRQVDARLAARYFETLEAPCKRLVWFESSAHNVPFEEPEAFQRAVLLDAPVGATAGTGCASRRTGCHP
jgi:pimeloyl-ACP methyl ester carboxylesterase